MEKKIRLIITDDHALLREAWKFILDNDINFKVLAVCASGQEALEQCKQLRPDVVLMDINLPGMNGIEATHQTRKYSPGTKVLALSQHTQPAYARKIMLEGASGYVTKNSSKDELYTAIIEVYKGNKYVCREIKENLSKKFLSGETAKPGLESLSAREMEIVSYVKKGYSSKEIANILSLAVKTVEVHRHNILKKLNLKNAAALVNLINNEYPVFDPNVRGLSSL
jgi:DNA-binding NarL/FixJ family response regulator